MLLFFNNNETVVDPETIAESQEITISNTHFHIHEFSEMIDRFGAEMKYYQSIFCGCVVRNNGHPDKDCGCNNGYWYPYAPVEVKLLRTQVDKKTDRDRVGQIESGACQITVPVVYYTGSDRRGNKSYSECPIYYKVTVGDVFVIPGRRKRDRDVLRKGTNDIIKAFDVQQILSVTTEDLTFYTYGTDYIFNPASREIEWIDGGSAPETGEYYTVEFESLLQYIVYRDLDKDRGGDDDYLPKRFVCNLRTYINFDDSNPLDVQPG